MLRFERSARLGDMRALERFDVAMTGARAGTSAAPLILEVEMAHTYIAPEPDPEPELTLPISNYEVVGSLGRGGMAEVFLVRSRKAGQFWRRCALKRVHPAMRADARVEDMFAAEVRLGGMLQHPNIVLIFDAGRDDEGQFLVMEYVDGISCARLLSRAQVQGESIPTGCALYVAECVARALGYAHALRDGEGEPLGLVHRDVSPSNILLGHLGEVKLADFGVARSPLLRHRTENGTVKGKLGYMAPEQAHGATLDARSDIFSLGVVLYELLTVQPLFRPRRGATIDGLRALKQGTIPPPSSRRDGIPRDVDEIVLRALRTDPAERFASADAMADALRAAAVRHGFAAEPASVQEVVAGFGGTAITVALGSAPDVPSAAPRSEPSRARSVVPWTRRLGQILAASVARARARCNSVWNAVRATERRRILSYLLPPGLAILLSAILATVAIVAIGFTSLPPVTAARRAPMTRPPAEVDTTTHFLPASPVEETTSLPVQIDAELKVVPVIAAPSVPWRKRHRERRRDRSTASVDAEPDPAPEQRRPDEPAPTQAETPTDDPLERRWE